MIYVVRPIMPIFMDEGELFYYTIENITKAPCIHVLMSPLALLGVSHSSSYFYAFTCYIYFYIKLLEIFLHTSINVKYNFYFYFYFLYFHIYTRYLY